MKKTLLLLCGGRSGEHEVSLRSARYIASCIDRASYEVMVVVIARDGTWYHITEKDLETRDVFEGGHTNKQRVTLAPTDQGAQLWSESGRKYLIDSVFPAVHGLFGEDGTLQGLLEMMGTPYVGCATTSAVVCMDKQLTKERLMAHDIAVVPYHLLCAGDPLPSYTELCERFDTQALFIKPTTQGSSLGVFKVSEEKDFAPMVKKALCYGKKILIEKAVVGREIECAVLGNEQPKAALPLGEIVPKHDFYSYEAKYVDPEGASLHVPADMDPERSALIREMAVRAFQCLECTGLARVDFLVTDEIVYINEVNTMPGFTSISLYPKMWEASGLSGAVLVQRLLDLAYERFAQNKGMILDASAYLSKATEIRQQAS